MLIEHLGERRLLASVSGIVFQDPNSSWRQDVGESPVASRIVFSDGNDNGTIDDGEAYQLTDATGRFALDILGTDATIVRLFSGSEAAGSTNFPIAPLVEPVGLDFTGGDSIVNVTGAEVIAIAGTSLIRGNLASGQTTSSMIPGVIRDAQRLPDGQILVLATDTTGNQSFRVDAAGIVSPVVLQASGAATVWADAAIDASGNGVVVEQSDSSTLLRAIAVGSSIVVGTTTTSVGAGTRVTGGGSLSTVISTPTDNGISLRLWSNATGTEITEVATEVVGGREVVSYDDASGLVLVRNAADSVTVLDAAANFASLQTIPTTGRVLIDGDRDLFFDVSPSGSTVRVIDLVTATTLGHFTIAASSSNPSAISSANQVAMDPVTRKLLVLGGAGIATVRLQPSSSYTVLPANIDAAVPLNFALSSGVPVPNTPPRFVTLPRLQMDEDNVLVVPSSELFLTAIDDQNDSFVVLLDTQAAHGRVTMIPSGGLRYVPDLNFFGVDRFKVILHDGRAASDPIELSINVLPVNDPLSFTVTPNVVPENVPGNFVVGLIDIDNVDGGTIRWILGDPRFKIVGNQILIVPGSRFDFETEPVVDVSITASESSSSERITSSIRFAIGDIPELVLEIKPDTATVDENRPGELIAEISVVDIGEGEQYEFTVDDDRFYIDARDLRLKPGVSLDFEAAATVTVNITATSATGATKSEPLVITVRDLPEQTSSLTLAKRDVIELVRGAVVGEVIVDGNPLPASLIATVDDSRFEVVNKQLRLRSSEFVRFADQAEIQVVITVQDSAAMFLAVAQTFVIEVIANQNPFHNRDNPFDVNGDGLVNPLDALLVINGISRNRGPGPISSFPAPNQFYDVNGDGLVSALDALLIINFINRVRRGLGEGEQAVPVPVTPPRPSSIANELAAPPIVGHLAFSNDSDDELKAAIDAYLAVVAKSTSAFPG